MSRCWISICQTSAAPADGAVEVVDFTHLPASAQPASLFGMLSKRLPKMIVLPRITCKRIGKQRQ